MKTPRVQLRRLQNSDFENMRLLDADFDVMRFTPARIPQSEEQTRERLRSQIEKQKEFEPFGIWVAEEPSSRDFFGWFMLRPSLEDDLELGFMLPRAQWGKGLATEIGHALIAFAKAQGIKRMIARTRLDNFPSMRVLEKLGFRLSKSIFIDEPGVEGKVELKFFEIDLG